MTSIYCRKIYVVVSTTFLCLKLFEGGHRWNISWCKVLIVDIYGLYDRDMAAV